MAESPTSTDALSPEVDAEVLDDEPRSIIIGIISQLRKGMDLHRVTLPTFVLEPRSFLERITDFMSHPDLILEYVFLFRYSFHSLLFVSSLFQFIPHSLVLFSCHGHGCCWLWRELF